MGGLSNENLPKGGCGGVPVQRERNKWGGGYGDFLLRRGVEMKLYRGFSFFSIIKYASTRAPKNFRFFKKVQKSIPPHMKKKVKIEFSWGRGRKRYFLSRNTLVRVLWNDLGESDCF